MSDTEKMSLHDYYYDLPEELIAQDPLEDRSSSRLMVLDKENGNIEHHVFKDIIDYLKEGDCLVINDTKVLPARLYGNKVGTDARIEVLLLKRHENDVWETLVKPGKKCKVGTVITFGDGLLKGEVIDIVEEGNRLIQFQYEGIFEEVLDQLGEMPLPPYITHKLEDKNRYQTVYAKYEGSAAAPTAGLHFTKELLEELIQKYYDNIYRFCYYKTGNASISYDLTQETFAIAVKNIPKFRGDCKVSSWLCQIAKHLWYKELKRNKKVLSSERSLQQQI